MVLRIDHKVLKTAIASLLAYLIAEYFNIKGSLTASIVAILSIQTTKAESIKISLERFFAVILGLALFVGLIYFLGFSYITFGIFIFIYMSLYLTLKLFSGFNIGIVLATHILAEKTIEGYFLLNEFYIFLIGALVGNFLNAYMPTYKKEIKRKEKEINKLLKVIFQDIAETLRNGCVSIDEELKFKKLKDLIKEGKKLSKIEYQNTLFEKESVELDHFYMRERQYQILKRIRVCFKRLYMTYDQNLILSAFFKKISKSIHIKGNSKILLEKFEKLKEFYSKMELPQTREEFENRATLFQLVQELEDFLEEQKELEEEETNQEE